MGRVDVHPGKAECSFMKILKQLGVCAVLMAAIALVLFFGYNFYWQATHSALFAQWGIDESQDWAITFAFGAIMIRAVIIMTMSFDVLNGTLKMRSEEKVIE